MTIPFEQSTPTTNNNNSSSLISSSSSPPQIGGEVSPLEEQRPPSMISEDVENNNNNVASSDDDDDDDDMTVIILENGPDSPNFDGGGGFGWGTMEQDTPEMEERRRNVLLRELQRVQRASFIHFLILCLIPTSLLFIVIATVLGEDEDCTSEATTCEQEPRTFINAFTTRCVCDAITIATGET